MSHPQDINATQMIWQPPLIKLTSSPHPDVDGGKSSNCYKNPQHITTIERKAIKHWKMDAKDESYPPQLCTAVVVSSQLILYVTESPDQVAAKRNEALGHLLTRAEIKSV